jgi:fucose permease
MRTLPIFLVFFLMGLADAMGPMSDAVEKHYQVSKVMSTLLPFFVFIAFAIFSVPGGLLAARIGKKKILLLGLGLNAVACLIPSLQAPPSGAAGLTFSAGYRHDVSPGFRQSDYAGT